jgi:iron complex outermembrane receptor protein
MHVLISSVRSCCHFLSRRASACTALLCGTLAPAAEPTASGAGGARQDPLQLSPFVVETTEPDEYTVENSTGATRIRTPIHEIPVHISVVTDELLRDTASFQLDEAVDFLGGVARSSSQGYNIRGFGAGSSLRNGIRSLNKPDASLMSRVEVVKGPAALLYGTSEPGGVLNYVSKRPAATRRTQVLLAAGNRGLWRGEMETSGPVGKTGLRYLLTLSHHQSDFAPRYREELRQTVSPILEWQATPETQLTFRYSYQWEDQIGTGGLPFKPGNHPDRQSNDPARPVWVAELGPGYGKDSPYSMQEMTTHTWELEATHRFTRDLNLRLLAGFFESDGQRIREGSTALNAGTYLPGVRGLRNTSWLGELIDGGERTQVQADLVATRRLGPFDSQLLVGAEYGESFTAALSATWNDPNRRVPRTIPGFTVSGPTQQVRFLYDVFDPASIRARDEFARQYLPPLSQFEPDNVYARDLQENHSGYANLQLTWDERRGRIMAGLRYDRVELKNDSLAAAGGALLERRLGTTDRYTPQVGISYRLLPMLTGYALYSQSVKPRFSLEPARTTIAEQRLISEAAAANLPAPNPDTLPWGRLRDPEFGEGFELGAKWDAAQRRLGGTAAVFRIEKKNAVSAHSNPVLQAVGFRELGGLDRVTGADLDVHWSASEGLQLIAHYTYLESESVRNDNPNLVGRPLFEAPRHQGGFWARYRFGGGGRPFTFGLGVTAMDKRRADPSPFSWSASWYRVDVQAGYRTRLFDRATTFNLNVKNLTDESYFDQRDTPAAGLTTVFSIRLQL